MHRPYIKADLHVELSNETGEVRMFEEPGEELLPEALLIRHYPVEIFSSLSEGPEGTSTVQGETNQRRIRPYRTSI